MPMFSDLALAVVGITPPLTILVLRRRATKRAAFAAAMRRHPSARSRLRLIVGGAA